MKLWTLVATFWVLSFTSWQNRADGDFLTEASSPHVVVGHCMGACSHGELSLFGQGELLKVSGKSRRIARRLDATGYYSRYSRALKGYPHLRSKKYSARKSESRQLNGANRKLYSSNIQKIARAHRLDPKLMDAVIIVESAYDPKAVSSKGAIGLMQLMPDTAERFNVSDPFNPVANMQGGARYLRWLMDRFDNDLQLVLAAYNAGEGAVKKHGNTIPPYDETRTYINRVLTFYQSSGAKR